MNRLPDDLLLHISAFLPSRDDRAIPIICREWQSASTELAELRPAKEERERSGFGKSYEFKINRCGDLLPKIYIRSKLPKCKGRKDSMKYGGRCSCKKLRKRSRKI